MVVAPVFGVINSQYGYDNFSVQLVLFGGVHPSANQYTSAVGQTFTAGGDGVLRNITVWMMTQGDPSSGVLRCRVCSLNDTAVESSEPSAVLATSYNSFWVNDTSAVEYTAYAFLFSPLDLTVGGNYSFYVYVASEGWSPVTDELRIAGDNTAATAEGIEWEYLNGDWAYGGVGKDMCYVIDSLSGNSFEGGGEGGGTQGGGGSGGDSNTWDTARSTEFYDVIVIIVFLFAPAVVLTLMKFGKWGFIGGFTVGALALVTGVNVVLGRELFPAWGLYGVVVVDVVAVWGSVKGVF